MRPYCIHLYRDRRRFARSKDEEAPAPKSIANRVEEVYLDDYLDCDKEDYYCEYYGIQSCFLSCHQLEGFADPKRRGEDKGRRQDRGREKSREENEGG